MPATAVEKHGSPQVTTGMSGQANLEYLIHDASDETAALAALAAAAPSTYMSMAQESLSVQPVDDEAEKWEGTARYTKGSGSVPQTGDSAFSFDTTGGTQHITQSVETIGGYAPTGGTVPDFQGAIGVSDNSVEGVDITVPVYKFSETHYLPASEVDNTFKGMIFDLTGKVNNATFKGLAAGECLFLGAQGSRRGTGPDDDWEITLNYAASPNKTSIVIGDITVTAKKGWEYLWIRYENAVDGVANRVVKVPTAAYVEKVYDEADFSPLDL